MTWIDRLPDDGRGLAAEAEIQALMGAISRQLFDGAEQTPDEVIAVFATKALEAVRNEMAQAEAWRTAIIEMIALNTNAGPRAVARSSGLPVSSVAKTLTAIRAGQTDTE